VRYDHINRDAGQFDCGWEKAFISPTSGAALDCDGLTWNTAQLLETRYQIWDVANIPS
jgi:hypothetical protein